jgi:hypothetical protein
MVTWTMRRDNSEFMFFESNSYITHIMGGTRIERVMIVKRALSYDANDE